MIQIILMTSDNQYHCLPSYFHQFDKYWGLSSVKTTICGFSSLPIELQYPEYSFYSIGDFADYPADRWSDAFIKVLDNVAEEIFILMLDDYWLVRQADATGIEMIYDYMRQFQNVVRFDLTTDRLFAEGGGKYLFNNHNYDTLGYLDLIKSSHNSQYHLSLWGAMWRRDLLKKFLVKGESAQQIELNGTHRLGQVGDELLVLGTRQSPLKHANVVQRGEWNEDPITGGLPSLKQEDLEQLRGLGYVK